MRTIRFSVLLLGLAVATSSLLSSCEQGPVNPQLSKEIVDQTKVDDDQPPKTGGGGGGNKVNDYQPPKTGGGGGGE